MKRRVLLACLMTLGLTVAGLGCGEDEPNPPSSPDTGTDADTVVDATDATDATDDDTEEGDVDEDVVEDGGGDQSCMYQGSDQGVCTEGTVAGELEDGGVDCQAPDTYADDEGPGEDGELCDDLDNDCDGVTDEGCECNFLGREAGICNQGVVSDKDGSCEPPEGYESDETTCDGDDNDCDGVEDENCRCVFQGGDMDTGVCEQGQISEESGDCEAPGDYVDDETNEQCDSKDNDCDGEVDENCSCTTGDTEDCYTGPSGTEGTGICAAGTRTCQDDGTWGECMEDTTPDSGETCDGDDNDCDGTTDEGCSCDYKKTSTGVCSDGTIGSKGNCKKPSDYEQDETSCDGVDNDCDGTVDEDCPCAYNNTSTGVCGDAKIDPDSGDCAEPDDYESTESSCDSKDNDCDGDVDGDDDDLSCTCNQGDTEDCYTGPSGTEDVGECESGTKTCQSDGTYDSCTGDTTPSDETCDGDDNDCDGATDEGCTCDYNMQSDGVCENQTRDSDGNCPEPTNYEDPEATCDDGLDNDCDADADCADNDCAGQVCGTGSGATCQNSTCTENQCGDGNDNDQDGKTDCKDPDCRGESCGTGVTCCPNGSCRAACGP